MRSADTGCKILNRMGTSCYRLGGARLIRLGQYKSCKSPGFNSRVLCNLHVLLRQLIMQFCLGLVWRVLDDAHAVFRSEKVLHHFLSSGIIAPHFIREEPVFVTARLECHGQMPHTIATFVHRTSFGVPAIEVSGHGHLAGSRGWKGELGYTVTGGEIIVFE